MNVSASVTVTVLVLVTLVLVRERWKPQTGRALIEFVAEQSPREAGPGKGTAAEEQRAPYVKCVHWQLLL